MISSLFITSNTGTILLYRAYDGDTTKEDATIYCRNAMQNKELISKPLYRCGKMSYYRLDLDELTLVAISKGNVNSMLVFHFLHDLRKLIYTCMNSICTKEAVLSNVSVLYELFDEVVDSGYPQHTERSVLVGSMAISPSLDDSPSEEWLKRSVDAKLGYLRDYGLDESIISDKSLAFVGKFGHADGAKGTTSDTLPLPDESITMMATVLIQSLRPLGLNYLRNVINVNVVECVNVLYSNEGKMIKCDISGSLAVDCNLSGMPICHLRLNTDLNATRFTPKPLPGFSLNSEFTLPAAARQYTKLDDYKLHQSVDLGSIESSGTISFVPPDKPFVLMLYRASNNVTLPFTLQPKVRRLTSTSIQFNITLKPTFSKGSVANRVSLRIPLPKNSSHVTINSITPHTTHDIDIPLHQVKWNIKKISKEHNFILIFTCTHSSTTFGIDPYRVDPIEMEFELPLFISSGLYVVSLDITNKTKMRVSKNISYLTKGGSFLHRINCAL